MTCLIVIYNTRVCMVLVMAYNQAVVIAGGIAHVPVLIAFFKFVERNFARRYKNLKTS